MRCGISPVQEDGPQGERFSRYACIVALPASGEGWSGRPVLHPIGWRVGDTAKHHRICRYVPDAHRGGPTDSSPLPPERHAGVTGPLLQQNFLVVRGDQACPDGTYPAGALHMPARP